MNTTTRVWNLSAAPHDRGALTTRQIMYLVILALMPATILGAWAHGVYSLLVILVSAFAGREHILEAYKQAVENKYHFFSYGDAMFIC